MNRVQRPHEKLQNLNFPLMTAVTTIGVHQDDVVIVAAGFEDRAMRVLQLVTNEAKKIKIIVIEFLPFNSSNKLKEILQTCENHLGFIDHIVYDRENPTGIGEVILNCISNVSGRIFIDISAMPRLLIVQLIVAIGQSPHTLHKTSIAYCEAEVYYPRQEEYEAPKPELVETNQLYRENFISAGVFEVIIVPELSSIASQGQPTRLVAMPSFNSDQLVSLRAELQPAYFSIVHGIPPYPEYQWRVDAIKRINSTENIPDREDVDISTLDYREMLQFLIKVYDDRELLERIIIAPIGSKMQAVAIGLFRVYMNDVQIAYPTPSIFSPEYTSGSRACYRLDLDTLVLPDEVYDAQASSEFDVSST
jgi:hypothetical protein